jgi:steroid delta-isomerase-like uncharacterized protein
VGSRWLRHKEQAMAPEENKAVVRRFVEEVFNNGNLAAVDQFLAAEYHDANALPGQEPGREGAKRAFSLYQQVFADLRYTIEEMIAEGNTVVTRVTFRATHRGAFLGIPPTNRQVSVPAVHITRLVDGKIREHWSLMDDLGLMQQLGVLPAVPTPNA